MNKIKKIYISLYNECMEFITDPISFWRKVHDEQRTWADTQSRILYPLLAMIAGLGVLRVIIEYFYISGYDFLKETLLALAWPAILAISLLIAAVIGHLCIRFFLKKTVDFERMVVFLSYTEIPVLLSAALLAILPFMLAVLIFINFYTAYVIMSGYTVYFADIMGEERKYHYPTTLATFIIIYALTYGAWGALAKI